MSNKPPVDFKSECTDSIRIPTHSSSLSLSFEIAESDLVSSDWQVPGRLYPIEMEYCPLNKDTELYSGRTAKTDPTPYLRIMKRIDGQYPPTERGDMLVFLSGMTEIMSVVEAARMYGQQVGTSHFVVDVAAGASEITIRVQLMVNIIDVLFFSTRKYINVPYIFFCFNGNLRTICIHWNAFFLKIYWENKKIISNPCVLTPIKTW